jgi:UDP-N-acetylglucosamine 2-epimerase
MAKRRVAVVTGTRAEYGLLVPVMGAIQRRRELELQVVVTGMHLLRRFGYTVREIEADGWPIGAKVRLQGEKDDVIGQSRGLSRLR